MQVAEGEVVNSGGKGIGGDVGEAADVEVACAVAIGGAAASGKEVAGRDKRDVRAVGGAQGFCVGYGRRVVGADAFELSPASTLRMSRSRR